MSTFKSENAAVIKALTHPFLATLVVISWVAMIFAGTDIPVTFEGMAVGVAGSWALKRSYKEFKKVQTDNVIKLEEEKKKTNGN